jgi:hypothetical protein
MLDELRDVAGQHELVAENFQEKVIVKINQTIKTLKDERRKVDTHTFIRQQKEDNIIFTSSVFVVVVV